MNYKRQPLKFASCPASFILLLTAFIFTSCAKEEGPAPVIKSSAKQITSFKFLLSENDIDEDIVATINEEDKTISSTIPPGPSITELIAAIEVSPEAIIKPDIAQNFTHPVEYTVTAEDGSKVIYTASVHQLLSQRQILQAILDANPENTLAWDLANTNDVGTLSGVDTDVNGIIIGLALHAKSLSQMPPEIGQLVNLIALDWSNNELASLPNQIWKLTKLKNLNLHHNSIASISNEIAHLTELTELDLSENNIPLIPSEIGQLTKLSFLDLRTNNLTSIPPEIGLLKDLENLNIRRNNITSIPAEIGQLSNLTTLNISQNSINLMPPEIGLLTRLTKLFLSSNNVTVIPPEIGLLTKLQELDCGDNKLNLIAPEIGFLTDLLILKLGLNNLSVIPQCICQLITFNDLSVLADYGVKCETSSQLDALIGLYSANPDNTLAWSLDNYPQVEFNSDREVTNVGITNKNLRRIPNNIDNLTKLHTLVLSGNDLGAVPSSIGNISTLTVLNLFDTNINTVPANFGKLTSMVILVLEKNPITSIPESVCDLQISRGGILTIVTDTGEGCE